MNKPFQGSENEITFKDMILRIQLWWGVIWAHRSRVISLSVIIGFSAALYMKFIAIPTYTASYQLFFEEEVGGVSSAMRLASSFGLATGGSGATSLMTVQEYITSRDNLSKVISVELDSGRLLNRYYATKFDNDDNFAIEFRGKFGVNKRYSDSIISKVTYALNEHNIVASLDEKKGKIYVSIKGENESFVHDLAHLIISNTKEVFIDKKKKKYKSAVKSFQLKVDSLERSIDATLTRLGEYEDQNNSLVSSLDKMKRMRLNIEMEALKMSYGQYIKGLEMSKAELMNIEPPFKYFDAPTYPLLKKENSVLNSGIFALIITGMLASIFIIVRLEVRNIMTE